jgi:hypothetical protein
MQYRHGSQATSHSRWPARRVAGGSNCGGGTEWRWRRVKGQVAARSAPARTEGTAKSIDRHAKQDALFCAPSTPFSPACLAGHQRTANTAWSFVPLAGTSYSRSYFLFELGDRVLVFGSRSGLEFKQLILHHSYLGAFVLLVVIVCYDFHQLFKIEWVNG